MSPVSTSSAASSQSAATAGNTQFGDVTLGGAAGNWKQVALYLGLGALALGALILWLKRKKKGRK